jgi:hypothetical protein
MNHKIAKLWAAALRSGDYKQGRFRLRNSSDQFCCLGVLCNLHAQAHPKIAAQQRVLDAYLGNSASLPDPVVLWADIETGQSPWIVGQPASRTCFTTLNDTHRLSFNQIADLIDVHWKKI